MPRGLPVTLRQLEVFAAVAREGSFTRAAETLVLSEPAVSQQIKTLERVVGARLLDRPPRKGVRLTEAGRRLLVACDSVFLQLEGALESAGALQRFEEGCVAFGAAEGFCGILLPSLYASFQRRKPGITIRVDMGPRRYLIDAVLRQHLDIAVVTGPFDDRRLASAPFASLDLVLIGPPGHQLSVLPAARFQTLALEHIIAGEDQSSTLRLALERKAADIGVKLQVSWQVGSMEAQINAVRSDLGIATLPFYGVASRIEAGTASLLQVEGFPIRLDWYLVWLPGNLSSATESFRDHLLGQRSEVEAVSLCPAPEPGSSSQAVNNQ